MIVHRVPRPRLPQFTAPSLALGCLHRQEPATTSNLRLAPRISDREHE